MLALRKTFIFGGFIFVLFCFLVFKAWLHCAPHTCSLVSNHMYWIFTSFNELAMYAYSKSLIQSVICIATPKDDYSAVFKSGEGIEFSYFYSPKWFMLPIFIRKLLPPCKDHFPWLHLTTGTILSIGSLIQSDWIHCSAVLMDVLWSLLSLNSHLNPLFNLQFEFPPKNGAPLSSER